MSKSIMMSKKKITHTYTLVTTSWTSHTCSCSLGFKLPNRDLLGWLIILRWLFCHWSVFYWSKCTKLCQNRSWYQNKTRYYNYNYTSHTFTKTHVLCVHRVPNYGTNYPTWLFPMSVTRYNDNPIMWFSNGAIFLIIRSVELKRQLFKNIEFFESKIRVENT